MHDRRSPAASAAARRTGVARMLSKAGCCSRSEAARWVALGRVTLNGRPVNDPEHPVTAADRLAVDGQPVGTAERIHLVLNKPRGLVTTAQDERGRDTVYRCFDDAGLPWIAPVGRLDRASEGLLLFSNDPEWSAAVTDPARGPDKVYHVQIDTVPDDALLARLEMGVSAQGERLRARSAQMLRAGGKRAWLEIVLDEGKNRQIRRLLAACGVEVLRLVRTAIGPVVLGDLPKGAWRRLDPAEVAGLVPTSGTGTNPAERRPRERPPRTAGAAGPPPRHPRSHKPR